MYRCQTITWAMSAWSMIFTYTLLTYFEQTPIVRSIPLFVLFATALLLTALIAHAVRRTKIVLVISTWTMLSLVAICLRTLDIITDWHLNLLMAAFTFIAAGIWCIVGHVEDVTESGLYWYIWSLMSIGTILCAFNNSSQIATVIYITNAAIISLVHIVYIRHIFVVQTSGPKRCRHLFRVLSCLGVILMLLVGSICFKADVITMQEWQQWVIVSEIVLLALLFIDSILNIFSAYSQRRVNGYDLADTNDDPV